MEADFDHDSCDCQITWLRARAAAHGSAVTPPPLVAPHGCKSYPHAREVLITADSGGSNHVRQLLRALSGTTIERGYAFNEAALRLETDRKCLHDWINKLTPGYDPAATRRRTTPPSSSTSSPASTAIAIFFVCPVILTVALLN